MSKKSTARSASTADDAIGDLFMTYFMKFTGQLCAALEREEFRNKTPQEQLEHLRTVSECDEVAKKTEEVNRLRNEYGYIDEDISEKVSTTEMALSRGLWLTRSRIRGNMISTKS
jgi:hypothetical protein